MLRALTWHRLRGNVYACLSVRDDGGGGGGKWEEVCRWESGAVGCVSIEGGRSKARRFFAPVFLARGRQAGRGSGASRPPLSQQHTYTPPATSTDKPTPAIVHPALRRRPSPVYVARSQPASYHIVQYPAKQLAPPPSSHDSQCNVDRLPIFPLSSHCPDPSFVPGAGESEELTTRTGQGPRRRNSHDIRSVSASTSSHGGGCCTASRRAIPPRRARRD